MSATHNFQQPGKLTRAPAGAVLPIGRVFDEMPLTREHAKVGFALLFAFIIDAWELLILSYVAIPVEQQFHVGPALVGWLLSALFLGMIPGAILWGPITDRIGRKSACIISLAAYGVVSLISAASVSFWMLWATRFLAGFAVTGVFTMVFPYFEELLPVRHRGRATVFLAAGWPFGVFIALGVSAALLHAGGWRAVIAVSSLASLWALVIWRWVPESPYWLAARGRQQEARAAIRRIGRVTVDPGQDLTVARGTSHMLREILSGRIGRYTVVQVLLNFAFSWGYWGLATWLPTLLQHRGFSVAGSFAFIAITTVAMIPGYVTAAFLTARFGRKWVFAVYIALGAVGGFFFAYADSLAKLYIGSIILYFFAQGAWGIWDTWVGELYPTRMRSVGYSWAVAGQRVANAIAPTIIGIFVATSAGFSPTVAFITAFLVVTLLLSFVFPETEGKELAS
jgi:MFS transporter, putative metabolite:H+ symporter